MRQEVHSVKGTRGLAGRRRDLSPVMVIRMPADVFGKRTGFRVQGAGCRGAGCRVQGSGCRAQGARFRVQGAGCRVQGLGPAGCPPRTWVKRSWTETWLGAPWRRVRSWRLAREIAESVSATITLPVARVEPTAAPKGFRFRVCSSGFGVFRVQGSYYTCIYI